MMRCRICREQLLDREEIVPVVRWVADSDRGDFATSMPRAFIHLKHLMPEVSSGERHPDPSP